MDAKIISMENSNQEKVPFTQEEAKQILNNLLSNEEGLLFNKDEGAQDLAALGQILSLPDKEFNILSELVIEELQKTLNDPTERLTLSQALAATGGKVEDLTDEYEAILNSLDEISDEFEPAKIGFIKRLLITVINSISEIDGIPKRKIFVPIELTHKDAKKPMYARIGDAGMDVYAVDDIAIAPGETKIIPLGFKVAVPNGYELQVRPRSGMSAKTPLRVANAPGTIDSGYRGEVGVILENTASPIQDIEYETNDKGEIVIKSILHSPVFFITKGEKFAQLVLSEVPTAIWKEVDDIKAIGGDRGGGFGSTGIK